MEKKLIDLHWEWMETGKMTISKSGYSGGLCGCVPMEYFETLQRFKPCEFSNEYWTEESRSHLTAHRNRYKYTPLRQAIVLFICVMHGEL